jgi:hypothetical protein
MIENTSGRDPLLHLAGAWGDSSRYITDMEAAGQRQLAHSDQLPTEITGGTQADFETLGFVFGDTSTYDPLFRPVTLPDGWRIAPSDHSMWSHVVDRNGRRRVAIFYKAAFYDRRAFMRLEKPENDLHRLLYGEITTLPVDDWTTPSVWIEVLTCEITRLESSADENEQYGLGKYAAEDRDKARRLGVWLETFQQSGDPGSEGGTR